RHRSEVQAPHLPAGVRGVDPVDRSVAVAIDQRQIGWNAEVHLRRHQISSRSRSARPPETLAGEWIDHIYRFADRIGTGWYGIVLIGIVAAAEYQHHARITVVCVGVAVGAHGRGAAVISHSRDAW